MAENWKTQAKASQYDKLKRDNAELGHVVTCLHAALREMIHTFEQPRFKGAYPECLARSRSALEAGEVLLNRPARHDAPTPPGNAVAAKGE